jgi:hypothetical protein
MSESAGEPPSTSHPALKRSAVWVGGGGGWGEQVRKVTLCTAGGGLGAPAIQN